MNTPTANHLPPHKRTCVNHRSSRLQYTNADGWHCPIPDCPYRLTWNDERHWWQEEPADPTPAAINWTTCPVCNDTRTGVIDQTTDGDDDWQRIDVHMSCVCMVV